MTSIPAARLQDEDFTYWFLREAFGWDVVLQLLWTFDHEVPHTALAAVHAALRRGPLQRRVVRPTVPLARPRWVSSGRSEPLLMDTATVSDDALERWGADELHSVDLDPEAGRSWRLRATRTSGGGTAVSLTCLHLVADGLSLTAAAADAVRVAAAADAARSARTPRVDEVPHPAGSSTPAVRALVLDAMDAALQVAGAARGIARAAVTAATGGGADTGAARPGAAVAGRSPAHVRAPKARPSWVVVSVDVDEWDAVATAHGGTRNSLFVAVVAGTLRSTGYADDGVALKVGIPVSVRAEQGDSRGNATAGVSVYLSSGPVAGSDLTTVRRLCKEAFGGLSDGRRPAMIHLRPLLQILPLSLVTRAVTSGGSGMPDVMVSNLGSLDRSLLDFGSGPASGVAFRGDARGVDSAEPHRFGEGLQSWYLEVGGRATFAVAGFDETRVGTAERLRDALAGELTAWNVTHRFW